MTDRNKPGLETGAKVFWGVIIAFAALAFYGWASGGWDRGYERERIKRIERGRRLKISADRNAAIIEKFRLKNAEPLNLITGEMRLLAAL